MCVCVYECDSVNTGVGQRDKTDRRACKQTDRQKKTDKDRRGPAHQQVKGAAEYQRTNQLRHRIFSQLCAEIHIWHCRRNEINSFHFLVYLEFQKFKIA